MGIIRCKYISHPIKYCHNKTISINYNILGDIGAVFGYWATTGDLITRTRNNA